LLAGIAVFIALQAGLFNIGVEGQFLVGALTAAVLGALVAGPLGLVIATLGGTLAGAVWAFPAAWIKAYRGGHEVISTIMLNNIAGFLTVGLVAGPLKAPGQQSVTTASIDPSSMAPYLVDQPPFRVHSALLLGVFGVAALAWFLRRRVAGYELRAVGANPIAARFAGVDARKVTLLAMVVSGAIGGLAGTMQVVAFEGRFYQGFSSGYGFDALGVALLAGTSAWALIPSALLFGALSKGITFVSATLSIPRGLGGILLGLLIIIFATYRYREKSTRG
jgi:simple sugar transport system permease protein